MVKASEKWARPRFFGGKGGLSGLMECGVVEEEEGRRWSEE
jgi:hypothetical protein